MPSQPTLLIAPRSVVCVTNLKSQGVNVIRTGLQWEDVEHSAGEYNWTYYDSLLDELESMNVTTLFCVHPQNSLYPHEDLPTDPASVAAFAKFFAALTTRYGGRPGYWAAELSNEPNLKQMNNTVQVWATFAVAAARAARANPVNANARIAGPAVANAMYPDSPGVLWYQHVVDLAPEVLSLLDVVTVHTYRPGAPESVAQTWQNLTNISHAAVPGITNLPPVVSGEWGYTSCTPSACWHAVSPATKALYLVREWLVGHALGRPVAVWYDWHDDCTDPTDRECRFGVVSNGDFSPLPAYNTARAVLSTLRGMWAATLELQPLQSKANSQDGNGDDDADDADLPALWAVTYTAASEDARPLSTGGTEVLWAAARAIAAGEAMRAGSQPASVDAAAVWAGVNSNSTAESGLRGNATLVLDAGRVYLVLNASGSLLGIVTGPSVVIEAGESPVYLRGQ